MDQELNKGPDEEKLKQLAVKITLDGSVDQQYTIQINYHANSPLKEQIGELFTTIPLKEATKYQEQVIAELKKEKEQLPTPENFDKLQEQNKLLDNYLQDLTDEESYQKIKQKVAEIK